LTVAAGWGDGIKDATAAIQMEIDALGPAGGVVKVPDGMYRIDAERSIWLRSGVTLEMGSQAALIAKPSAVERTYVLIAENTKDVLIKGGRIIGDRLVHTYSGTSTHEWGMGIAVYGSQNVTIEGVYVTECAGDGVVIGRDSSDVTIRNIVSTQNRRQGLTIGRGARVSVYDSEFSFTGALNGQPGAEPKDGIDIEPDSTGSALCEDVLIQNCRIVDNESAGIETMAVTARVRNVRIVDCEISRNSDGCHFQKCEGLTLDNNTIHDNRGYGAKLLSTTSTAKPIEGNTFERNLTRLNTTDRSPDLVQSGFTQARDLKVEATAGVCVAGVNIYK
jgi:parallel beta-helix repeat protein